MKKILYLLFIIFMYSTFSFSQDFFINERDIKYFTISPDSKLIAYIHSSPGSQAYINLFDIEKKSIIKKFDIKNIYNGGSLSFSPDTKLLAWNNYKTLYTYDFSKDKYESFTYDCNYFAFSKINNLLIVCKTNENIISLVDFKTFSALKIIKLNWEKLSFNSSFDGNSFVAYSNGKLFQCSFFPDQSVTSLDLRQGYLDSYAVSNNFNNFVAFKDSLTYGGFSEENFYKYELPKGIHAVISACFTPLDKYMVYIYNCGNKSDKNKMVVSGLSGNVINSFEINHPGNISITPNGKYIVVREDFGIKLWETKKLLPYAGYYITYYETYYKDYQNELEAVYEKSKTRGEFENQQEYEARISGAFALKKSIEEKYYNLLTSLVNLELEKQNAEYDKKNSEIQEKINKSIEPVETKITSVGTYNIDNELLPVTINGITENVKIKRDDAKSLKENFGSAIVKGKRRLKYDLKNYEFFELIIIHPVSNTEYKFGNW